MSKTITEMTETELENLIEKKFDEVVNNYNRKEYLNYNELAQYTGISVRKLKRLKANESIPYLQIEGSIRFKRKMIDLWMLHNGQEIDFTKRQVKRFNKYIE